VPAPISANTVHLDMTTAPSSIRSGR
jgi:hypothetical protein